jgi:hypothetical protein
VSEMHFRDDKAHPVHPRRYHRRCR